MMPEWMDELNRDSREFSQLCHDYYKLATLQAMQHAREKYKVPPDDIPTLTIAIFARMLNEAVYSVGAQINNGYPITNIYPKEQLLNLLNVLNGEPLDPRKRSDIETDLQKAQEKFKKFILENSADKD